MIRHGRISRVKKHQWNTTKASLSYTRSKKTPKTQNFHFRWHYGHRYALSQQQFKPGLQYLPPSPCLHPLLCSPSIPTLLWCVVTRSTGSSSMTDCYFLERKHIWLLTSGPLQLQTRALYINQEVISKQRDHPPINLLGSGGITCSCNPG